MFELTSDRLRAALLEPAEVRLRTIRFDQTAFIAQVTLDGRTAFCCQEPEGLGHPWTGGAGLCSEIRAAWPVAAAQPGGRFHKPGVGVLTKPDEKPYSHVRTYESEPYGVSWSAAGNEAHFEIRTDEVNGYALHQIKQVLLEANCLTVRYWMRNTGTQAIDIDEYCHNFVTIEGQAAGPDYRLGIPAADPLWTPRGMHREDGSLRLAAPAAAPFMTGIPGERLCGPFAWTLSHAAERAVITEEDSFHPAFCGLWACGRIFSPEVHFCAQLSPGEACAWERRWRFRGACFSPIYVI